MARRHAESVAQEPQGTSLIFNEPLSWRAGKPIATGELLKRLDALSNELREMDQEEIDKDSLTKVAKELAGQNLLSHKDKGVRAFTACCLVDVLKLCAPDAPFTGSQLKDIFTLFINSILPALSDPSNAYNTQHKYVLMSLAEVKSIVLLTDIPSSDSLTLHLFSNLFDIISGSSKASTGEQIAKDVEYNMSQMLVTLVDEAAVLPPQVVDIIVAQFLRATTPGAGKSKHGEARADEKQTTLLLKELPEAYNMAKTICKSCPEKMARYVSQYFNDVIMDISTGPSKTNGHRKASDAIDSDEDEGPAGPTEADLKELQKAHRLLRELWRASPAVLQNVIPQLEAELAADNVQLRLLATETLGDIISGIGAAGPPPPPPMDPAAYPPVRLEDCPTTSISNSILTTPVSPQSFAQTHQAVYTNFLKRKNDKSSVIRSGWTTAIGRILVTSAGGIGLSREDENALVRGLGEKLNDADEKVRLAAVKAISSFGFRDVMTKLAPNGGVTKSGSVLCSLADRGRDRRHPVRVEAMTSLSRIWGVAAGEIAAGNEAVMSALGAIPSKVFDAYYANDLELNVLLDHVMFEQLIPLSYPPSKSKASKATTGESQGASQTNGDGPFNADKIRTERILLVVRSLDTKSKKAFFAMQARQPTYSNVVAAFLKRCEEFNGGVMEGDSKEIKKKLDGVVNWLSDLLPDPLRTTNELLKYAKLHDRRSYQLLRFAIGPENDFKTVFNAIKEFSKRIESAPAAPAGLLETITPIIYRSASLAYNRSHLPFIMQYMRSDENGLGAIAQELMQEISERHPQIFKDNVKELCKSLAEQSPSATKLNDLGSVETLRALASFAKNPNSSKEIPHDRKFVQTLINFAQYGTPPKAAKYAVSVLMAASDRKEMHAKDLLEKSTQDWQYGEDHFLTKLATISQLTFLEPSTIGKINDDILDITTQKILLQVRTTRNDGDSSWQTGAEVDEECQAKSWALRILVNRLRATDDPETAKMLAVPVYKLLNQLIFKNGELSKKNDTPKSHKTWLRLLAAQLMLKLCTNKLFDDLLSPIEFNRLAFVSQDPLANVRRGFVEKLQKYLVKSKLSHRFYTIIFLTAFEPDQRLKSSIITWIRSRAKLFHDTKNRALESVFTRLISLLAHHPDFSLDPDELRDHAQYILYYITTVVTEENLPLVYKFAERVKQVRDAISGPDQDNIYVISDLATVLLKKWQEKKGWIMQTWPVKVGLPLGLYVGLPSHEVAQEIAEKQYLPAPEVMDSLLDKLVREAEKKKRKRKSDDRDDDAHPAKKHNSDAKPKSSRNPAIKKEKPAKVVKTPKTKKPKQGTSTPTSSPGERRKSGRGTSAKKTYEERDSSEDEKELWDGVASWEYEDGRIEKPAKAIRDAANSEDEVESSGADEGVEEEVATPEPEVEEEVATPEPEAEAEAEVVHTPTPPRSSARRASTRSSTNKPPSKASASKTVKSKAKPPRAQAKAKTPKSKPAARPKRGAARQAKDVSEMDLDED
ncbi:Sister chromatid cohesion protein pds5 [Lachnellula cervina]|uniref:Sister chromatid cohesion protein pds5 n=1 Tax=Lachnellula cervina TaxID=1316786 RepID=A0A7D8UPU4_9HELO|nr:Sister chromatid cohesion protein pds5 [Lachnellula cervina]